MDYFSIYKRLIDKGIERKSIPGYHEVHHIIPRCLGGIDDKSNLVNLTAKEHFIAHLLLWKIFPDHSGIIKAFYMMKFSTSSNQSRYITGLTYQKLKIANSKATSEYMKGNKNLLGYKHTEEAKLAIGNGNKGNTNNLGKSLNFSKEERIRRGLTIRVNFLNSNYFKSGQLSVDCTNRNKDNTFRSKLTKDEVINIFHDTRSSQAIAKDYNLGYLAIERIKAKQTWKHVTKDL